MQVMGLGFYKGETGDFTCQQTDPSVISTPLAGAVLTCTPSITFFSPVGFKVLKKTLSTGPGLKMMLMEGGRWRLTLSLVEGLR